MILSLAGVLASLVLLWCSARRAASRLVSADQGLAALTLFGGVAAFAATSAGYLELLLARPFFSSAYVTLAVSASSLVLFWATRTRPVQTPPIQKKDRPGPFFWLCLLMMLAVFALAVIVALSAPPRGYDGLWFHLPLADHMQRTGSLLPPVSFKWFWHPANMNVWYAALLTLTRGSALNLTGIFFLAMLTYLTPRIYLRLCLKEAQPQGGTLLIALWISTTPCYFFLSVLVLTDLPSIALTTLSLYWFIVWYQERTRALLFLTGLAVGLALGTKTAALPIFGGFGILLCFEFFWHRLPWRERASLLGLFLLGAFLAGGFWYVRNGVLLHNPFHPLTIAVGPFQLGEQELGLIDPQKELRFLGGSEWWRWLYFPFVSKWYSHEWGMGVLPGVFVLVGFLSLPFLLFRRALSPLVRALLFLVVLHLIGWWTVSRHFRHLLLLWPVALPLLMRLFLQIRGARVVAFLWSIVAIGTLAHTTLGTIRWEQSLEEEPNWHAYYGLPSDYEAQLPAGTVIANLIGEPNHFPLLGIDGRYRVIGYNDAQQKSAAQLRALGASHAVSLQKANKPRGSYEGFTLVSEWHLPRRFRWWGFFRREPAVLRLWSLSAP